MSVRGYGRPLDPESLVDAIVDANRFLVQLSVRVLERLAPDLNMTEFRTLALLSQRGPQRLIDIASALDVTSTTATRLADRLVGQGMVERVHPGSDRRETHLAIATSGRALVKAVLSRRRRHVASALVECAEGDLAAALDVLDRLAGQIRSPEQESA